MVQQASAIAESERSEASARAASLLLQDVVDELEGVAKAAEDADAAGVPATFNDGHTSADAALANLAAAASERSTATDAVTGVQTDTVRRRRATAPSFSSTASTSTASSPAVNGRNTSSAVALTSALTGPDPDINESRSADRPYLNSLTYSSRGVQAILPQSVLPYESYWLNARGV